MYQIVKNYSCCSLHGEVDCLTGPHWTSLTANEPYSWVVMTEHRGISISWTPFSPLACVQTSPISRRLSRPRARNPFEPFALRQGSRPLAGSMRRVLVLYFQPIRFVRIWQLVRESRTFAVVGSQRSQSFPQSIWIAGSGDENAWVFLSSHKLLSKVILPPPRLVFALLCGMLQLNLVEQSNLLTYMHLHVQ